MKPLALNLKNAKKVSTDQHSSTFQLGSGHQIKVLHAPLPALQRKQVMEMPVHKFDVGGEVPAEQSPEQEVEPISEPASDDNSVEPIANRSPAGDQTSQIQAPQPAAAQQVAPQATLGIDPTQAYNQGLGAIQTQGQLNAETAQGQAQVNAQYIEDQKKFQQGAQSTLDAISDQSQKTLEDMKNQHINPNHYVENMSAPQKVATAIGLVLGGFGSAFTGQGNPAKQFLDQQIDRDIQGQQMRMDQSTYFA